MFEYSDIKYIILSNDSEVKDLINHIRSINRFNDKVEIMSTKITTVDRIKEDH